MLCILQRSELATLSQAWCLRYWLTGASKFKCCLGEKVTSSRLCVKMTWGIWWVQLVYTAFVSRSNDTRKLKSKEVDMSAHLPWVKVCFDFLDHATTMSTWCVGYLSSSFLSSWLYFCFQLNLSAEDRAPEAMTFRTLASSSRISPYSKISLSLAGLSSGWCWAWEECEKQVGLSSGLNLSSEPPAVMVDFLVSHQGFLHYFHSHKKNSEHYLPLLHIFVYCFQVER